MLARNLHSFSDKFIFSRFLKNIFILPDNFPNFTRRRRRWLVMRWFKNKRFRNNIRLSFFLRPSMHLPLICLRFFVNLTQWSPIRLTQMIITPCCHLKFLLTKPFIGSNTIRKKIVINFNFSFLLEKALKKAIYINGSVISSCVIECWSLTHAKLSQKFLTSFLITHLHHQFNVSTLNDPS